MDYLRNLGSAAVSSLVQKSGLNLPFSLGAKVSVYEGKSIWTLYDATKRDDGSSVSVFEFDAGGTPSKRNLLPLAKNALRKLRTIRHPDVLKFMDVVETDTTVHIMTERVKPLRPAIHEWASKGAREREDWAVWGLHQISVALAFVNDAGASTHGNVRVDSIFISSSGEWKLGGFEVLSNPKDDAAVLYNLGSLLPDANAHASPEVKKGGWSSLKDMNPAAADSYALGVLIHDTFNPGEPLPATREPYPQPTAASRGNIPQSVFPSFKKLLMPSPKTRLSPKAFLELGTAQTAGEGGFFVNNRLVKVCAGLDNFSVGSETDKNALLKVLKESASSFPSEFVSFRVLPSLVSALEFGGASAPAILPLVLQLGQNVAPEDYGNVVLAPIVKLYASPDRGTRMALLDHLSEYADKLDKKIVVDKIWPNLQTGFTDTVAVIREATVKSIILLSDKLNDRILNNDLLRFLAKMQGDPEASIRTNTCILIGRLGPSLGYNTKKKVLVPAFTRGLKDPFVHARVAGLMAFMATIDCFDVEELATKVIPNMSFAMMDKEKLVRDQAFKAMELFVKKIEEHAATMPETAIPETEIMPGVLPPVPQGSNTLVNSAAGAAGALAGWAISSLGKKLVTADLQTTMSSAGGAPLDRPASAPLPLIGTANGSTYTAKPPALPEHTLSSPTIPGSLTSPGSSSKARGMQLGAQKAPVNSLGALANEWAEEAAEEDARHNPWGSDDLMDVNADQDDWSAFESAPVPVVGLYSVYVSPALPSPGSDWGSGRAAERSLSPHPKVTQTKSAPQPAQTSTVARSPTPSDRGRVEPIRQQSPAPGSAPATPSTVGMTKEEKAAELARRKEERKQRIAALKEKKSVGHVQG